MEDKFKAVLDSMERMIQETQEIYDRLCYSQMLINRTLKSMEEMIDSDKQTENELEPEGTLQERPGVSRISEREAQRVPERKKEGEKCEG